MKGKNRERMYEGAEARAAARDRLIFNVTDDLLVVMEDNGVSKHELARRLGKSKSFVSQILSGRRNMTLGTFSDICFALKFEPKIAITSETFSFDIPGRENQNDWYLVFQPGNSNQLSRHLSADYFRVEQTTVYNSANDDFVFEEERSAH